MDISYSEALVVGGGLAGLRAAIELKERGIDVVLISIVPPLRSHSSAAMGGVQAALASSFMGASDSPCLHYQDTINGGAGIADPAVVDYFCHSVIDSVYQLDSWGVPWTRVSAGERILSDGRMIVEKKDNHGKITARNFGGTAQWRTCYCSDSTGHNLMRAHLRRSAAVGLPIVDRMQALSLIMSDNTCEGVTALDLRTGKIKLFQSKATLLATGGYGRLFEYSTNGSICNGAGQALVLSISGGTLSNMEAVQFHPTALMPSSVLITEGCRGDGGYLYNNKMERFMLKYAPEAKELASRDVISRSMILEERLGNACQGDSGSHFWLDIRHLGREHISTHLREVAENAFCFAGVDPVHDLIPVYPAQHYTMGGIRTDKSLSTEKYGISGLFAAGEAACWDLHGFNRLGGNSLGETIVAGEFAAVTMSDYIQKKGSRLSVSAADDEFGKQSERLLRLEKQSGKPGLSYVSIISSVQSLMSRYAGVFRNEEGLNTARLELNRLLEQEPDAAIAGSFSATSPETTAALECRGMVKLALAVVGCALKRKESRGCHNRDDYPEMSEEFCKRTLCRWNSISESIEIDYEDISPQG
ncbi:MAG: fumarate reductase flavoprotein subunit [Spirochaetes bacterium]|jgi:fumarate reductase flavoprotein subunit|nr:fumarate reductase flavoprotein subunit [Spirochaetota bacterium]